MSVESTQLDPAVLGLVADAEQKVARDAAREVEEARNAAEQAVEDAKNAQKEAEAQKYVNDALGTAAKELDDNGKTGKSGRFNGTSRTYEEEARSRPVTVDGKDFRLGGTFTKITNLNWLEEAAVTLYSVIPDPNREGKTRSVPLCTVSGVVDYDRGKKGTIEVHSDKKLTPELKTSLAITMTRVAAEVKKQGPLY